MTNYNSTLQTNNSSLEEIITQLNNMPDASGSSGSGSIATCTIKIINEVVSSGHHIDCITYTTLDENGNISVSHTQNYGDTSPEITLQNVLCGSFFYVESNGYWNAYPEYSGGVIMLDGSMNYPDHFMAPTTAGAFGVITLVNDG